MPCLLCGAPDAEHRIVDPETGSVEARICSHCADRHLRSDERGPICELCGELADYDLAGTDAPDTHEAHERVDDLDLIAQNVLCEEDLGYLKENPPDAVRVVQSPVRGGATTPRGTCCSCHTFMGWSGNL